MHTTTTSDSDTQIANDSLLADCIEAFATKLARTVSCNPSAADIVAANVDLFDELVQVVAMRDLRLAERLDEARRSLASTHTILADAWMHC